MAHPRRIAREFCLKFLYHLQLPHFESEHSELSDRSNLERRIAEFHETVSMNLDAEQKDWSSQILHDVIQQKQDLREKIKAQLGTWKIERLSRVDLSILVLAAQELARAETPVNIVINEAIELAKVFGSKESPRFINGVLDGIKKALEKKD